MTYEDKMTEMFGEFDHTLGDEELSQQVQDHEDILLYLNVLDEDPGFIEYMESEEGWSQWLQLAETMMNS